MKAALACTAVLFTCWLNLSFEIHRMHGWLSYSNVKSVSGFCDWNLSKVLSLTSSQLRWALFTEKPLWNQSMDSRKLHLLRLGFCFCSDLSFNQKKLSLIIVVSVPTWREYFHESGKVREWWVIQLILKDENRKSKGRLCLLLTCGNRLYGLSKMLYLVGLSMLQKVVERTRYCLLKCGLNAFFFSTTMSKLSSVSMKERLFILLREMLELWDCRIQKLGQ